jgi:DNA topoisomerase VI subunit B
MGMVNKHARKATGDSTRCQFVAEVAKRLKSYARRQKHKTTQKAKNIKLKEKIVVVVESVSNSMIEHLLHMFGKLP